MSLASVSLSENYIPKKSDDTYFCPPHSKLILSQSFRITIFRPHYILLLTHSLFRRQINTPLTFSNVFGFSIAFGKLHSQKLHVDHYAKKNQQRKLKIIDDTWKRSKWQTGLVGGLFFTGLIWVVEVFALCLLVRVAEKYNSQSYQQMVNSVLGSRMAFVTSATMLIFLIGAMISYLIITGDVFAPIFAEKFGENSIFGNRRVVITFFALLVILPLSLQTTLRALKYSSMLSVVMLTYLTLALILIGLYRLLKDGFPSDVLIFQAGMRAFIILDIVVFAFQCHIQVVPIFAELSEHPHPFFTHRKDPLEEEVLDEEIIHEIEGEGLRSERVKRMDGVIFVSMSICFIGYSLVGEFGYLIFQDVESDVLKSFGNTNFFMNIARIGMAVVAMVCYPVQHHPARSIVDDAIKYVAKIPASSFSWTRHVFITLGFFSFTLLIALLITDLGKVFSIVGSTGGVMVVFIIPGILLLLGSKNATVAYTDVPILDEAAPTPGTRTRPQACIQVFGGASMMVFGLIIFIATIYVTVTGQIGGSD